MEVRILNIAEVNIDDIRDKVSVKRIEKTDKIKSHIDKLRSVSVEYLLNQMISELYPDIKTPVELEYDTKGKPHLYINDSPNSIHVEEINFSISHSGDYVACIISDFPCGIDIEKHSDKRDYEKVAKRICTEKEFENIHSQCDFYDLWTLKECVLKAVGLGLSLDMRKVEFERKFDESKIKYRATVNGKCYYGEVMNSPEGYSLSYVEEEKNDSGYLPA